LALIGLVADAVGFATAVFPAITGSGGMAAVYVALLSLVGVTIVVVILIALGATAALVAKRAAGVALMLGSAMFLVGFDAGYFVVLYGLYYT
jgi:hypothetical protein